VSTGVTKSRLSPGWTEHVLQPGQGPIDGRHYLPSTPDTVLWGYLPNRDSEPVLRIRAGETVTIDSVSHEGLLEDQARDPVGWFAGFGVPAASVLDDARAIAASGIPHHFDDDGPHVVTGPVHVSGAEPGDLLRIEVLSLVPRVHYGVISNRHGLGALPGEFPETVRYPDASVDRPERYGSVCTFTTVARRDGRDVGLLPYGDGEVAAFPLAPFMGVMGVARATSAPVPSVPPGDHGGNIDIKLLGERSTLYLPVQVPGALFYAGDPHYAQGNGEVALTALEAPLRVTVRLSLVPAALAGGVVGLLRRPFAETATHWIAVGLDVDLDEAMKAAVRAAIDFLASVVGMSRAEALAYLSAAGDFEVSQVVDAVKGVHCLIRKADFPGYRIAEEEGSPGPDGKVQ
jgi:acetamidase/formamidase